MAAEILGLTQESPEAMGKAVRGIEHAVAKSFREDRSRVTQDEIKRRGRICIGIVRALRKDLKWSIDRIVDELPIALRAKLDGIPWDPSNARTIWTPQSGTF